MRIRKATKKDIDILADFWYEEEKLHNKFDKSANLRKDARKRIYNSLKSDIIKNTYTAFIAEDKNEVVGIIQGKIKEGYFVNNFDKIGHYSTIFVKKKYRRKRVANELFRAMTKWFKSQKIKLVELYVHSQNKVALKAWNKLGFKEVLKLMKKGI